MAYYQVLVTKLGNFEDKKNGGFFSLNKGDEISEQDFKDLGISDLSFHLRTNAIAKVRTPGEPAEPEGNRPAFTPINPNTPAVPDGVLDKAPVVQTSRDAATALNQSSK